GLEMMVETLNDIIGKREDGESSRALKEIICEEEAVRGAYDVVIFNYGPDKNYASVHIELPDHLNVDDVDRISRKIQLRVFQKTGVILTGISVYSYNTTDAEAAKMREAVEQTVMAHAWALQIHGFYADTERKTMRFDVVLSFDIDRHEALQILQTEIRTLYPDYEITVVPDVDVTD
ncbi:MAG: cation transporter, partial [Clostridia bacterium]|nr:cation transporter [Clostridia bacterium]